MRVSLISVVSAAMLAVALPVLAHHASQAEFDKNSPKTVSGVLTRVQWTNPHVRWYLDIKNEKTGEVETWMLQGSGPGAYKANGVSAAGVVVLDARSCHHSLSQVSARRPVLSAGRRVVLWSAYLWSVVYGLVAGAGAPALLVAAGSGIRVV